MERNELFLYFSNNKKFKNANKNGNFLPELKEKLQNNKFSSLDEFKMVLEAFLNEIPKAEGFTAIERRSIQYLKKKITEKIDKYTTPNLVNWKSDWCEAYQSFASLSNEKLNIKMPKMRHSDDSLAVSEEEMISLKNKIIKEMDEEETETLIKLVSTLETGTATNSGEYMFDLHDLKNETLFAIKSFLKTVKNKSEEARLLKI